MKQSPRPTDEALDRLLGNRPALGLTEREAVRSRVLSSTSVSPARPAPWRWLAVGAASLAAAGVVLLIVRGPGRVDDELTARGAPPRPHFSVSCLVEGHPAPCRPGAKLVFALEPRGFEAFAAVAEAPDGTTVWLFPARDGETAADATRLLPGGLLDQVVTLDGPPGGYVVYGVFSHRRLDRDDVRRALMSDGGTDEVIAVQRVDAP
jgi:hypothetical protein